MIHDILTPDRISVAESLTWEEAIRHAAAPLVADGSVLETYVDRVVQSVQEPDGTYMDLGFGVTLAHARPEAGALTTSLSILTLRQPTLLADAPDHPLSTVLFLAAADATSHQDALRELAAVLMDPQKRDVLTGASQAEDIIALFEAP
ncbi:PTS sugar transporter subunit IIA [Kocuria sp. HSID16901]|uniref:PTS sugar transporter subunit IIA n=1 Tax=Kocuria sp. HSID16901 TaxID=2419505 RepID=UPI0006608D08|nr:PTS sugar transporter subunit IIA [Kocuria sp. HSID16901]MCT1366946.1 PTS sugar transporter subunit IIA [Rothia sp. p3-SID1597]RUQ20049.1 PTS sugar transporter subunit IIA [Kocuria sp. HSID16901]